VDDPIRASKGAGAGQGVCLAQSSRPLEAEVDGYVSAFVDHVDERGHRLVTRNGHAEARTVTTAAGGIEIEAPRVNDRRVDDETGERCRFRSAIVPPWCRKSPKVTEVLPLMYLHGMTRATSPLPSRSSSALPPG
jgi:hypothetical protein